MLLFNNTRRTLGALAALMAFSLSCDSSSAPDPDPGSDTSLQLSTITASQPSIVADGKTTSQITVSLKDAQGASIGKSGGVVTITSTRGTVGAVSDQNNGTYAATLTSSTAAGASIVSAAVGGAALSQLWLFWLMPVVGALAAGVAWRTILARRAEPAGGRLRAA